MAKNNFTINYEGHYGVVCYDDETKEITAQIPDNDAIAQKVVDFLSVPHNMDIPQKEILSEFQTVTINAKDSLGDFKQTLTRLWVNTGVLVEWSMPPFAMDSL